ncbi:MAG: Ycf51 family protein [Microcoleaceae cyanobacterium]
MLSTAQLLTYSQWAGIATLVFAVITGLGFIFNWGIRFRLVGVTAFMGVLAGGIFGLGLGLFTRTEIPGALSYSRVFDDGARQIVITVAPDITESQLAATLQQAGSDLFSPGRVGRANQSLSIRARTLIHPQPGISEPLYLGEIKRSLSQREDNNFEINLFPEAIAKLHKT